MFVVEYRQRVMTNNYLERDVGASGVLGIRRGKGRGSDCCNRVKTSGHLNKKSITISKRGRASANRAV